MKLDSVLHIITTTICCVIIGLAAHKMGYREGFAAAEAKNRATEAYVSEKARDLGFCEWADAFKKQHQCPNPHAPDPGFSPFSGRSGQRRS